MSPGDVFWFSGRCLGTDPSKGVCGNGKAFQSAQGQNSDLARRPVALDFYGQPEPCAERWTIMPTGGRLRRRLERLTPMLELQAERSHLPVSGEVLMEVMETKEGHHLFVYPMEGRLVHEGVASLMAYRHESVAAHDLFDGLQ